MADAATRLARAAAARLFIGCPPFPWAIEIIEEAIRDGQREALNVPDPDMGWIVHQAVIPDHIREGRGGRGLGENIEAGQAILTALRARVGLAAKG